MVTGRSRAWVHGAGAIALIAYGLLALHADDAEARPWLLLATVVGWSALGAVAWFGRVSPPDRLPIVLWAIAFRLVGIGTEPSWEDDYYRYLWDGYQTISTGDPYSRAPQEFFGNEGRLPDGAATALDLLNRPELPTVYGPVAQACFAAAAWVGVGSLAVWKSGLVLLEMLGWFWVSRVVSWRVALLLWWCPLGVTEIAFAGHVDGVGVAALALAMAAWKSGGVSGVVSGAALAAGTKILGAVLFPFVICRFGLKVAAWLLLALGAIYTPFILQGSWGGLHSFFEMSSKFEYNSMGFALLGSLLPDMVARIFAVVLVLLTAAGLWLKWWREGDFATAPPVAAIIGGLFLWSPVLNPWYALWLLPGWALRPSAWGVGVLVAIPLAYAHGWNSAGGATASYVHPWWTRPAEIVVFAAVVVAAAIWRRRFACQEQVAASID